MISKEKVKTTEKIYLETVQQIDRLNKYDCSKGGPNSIMPRKTFSIIFFINKYIKRQPLTH